MIQEPQVRAGEIAYVPFGERPEPYPIGYAPNPARWSGRELLRVELEPGEKPSVTPGLADPECRPAAVATDTPTARNSRRMQLLPASRLPAGRLTILEHITDDPGALAVHGRRLRSEETIEGTAEDGWENGGPTLIELPVGAVLVAVDTESDGTRMWRAWRVMPIGQPVAVFRERVAPGGRQHLASLAAMLDEDLVSAFASIVERYRRSGAEERHVRQMEQAVERWRFATQAGTRRKRRTRRRRIQPAATPATGIRPRMVPAAEH